MKGKGKIAIIIILIIMVWANRRDNVEKNDNLNNNFTELSIEQYPQYDYTVPDNIDWNPNNISYDYVYSNDSTYKIPTPELCKVCYGVGSCNICDGTGTYSNYGSSIVCTACKGSGDCWKCVGSGYY